LVPFDQITRTKGPRWLVKNLLPLIGLILIWGPPKCGKSFWIFDLVMHVALGWPYRGRRVQQGAVVYCAFEGQSHFADRVEAFRQRHLADDHEPVPFYLQPITLDLVREHGGLITEIKETMGRTAPAVIVLDTLNRSLRGSESSDEDMTAYIRASDAIREAFDCAVVIVHHCGVNDSRPRGHTALTGAADAQLSVKRDAAKNIVVELECAKDGPEGDVITSRLETVTVGTDDDGDPETSCVIVETDPAPAASRDESMPKNWQTMLAILHEAGPSGLSTEDWNERAREVGLGAGRRSDLYDFRRGLQRRGLVVLGTNGWFAKRTA
jgi:hypothetical protein